MNPVYIVASNLMNQREKLSAIADNVANANTVGYKRIDLNFEELVSRQQMSEVGSFSQKRAVSTDYTSGGMTSTKNPLDVAINGDGFFGIELDNGNVAYTRNGHFSLDTEGNLVNDRGNLVLDTNNAAINIPPDSKFVNITKDGGVSDQNGLIATLGVFEFDNEAGLKRIGAGNWITDEEPFIAEFSAVAQGMLEDSNVNSVKETVTMTEMLRSYQGAAKLIERMEDLESRGIREISRLP